MANDSVKKIKLTLVKGLIGMTAKQKSSIYGLGLRKRHSSRVVDATPENLGMINKMRFLLQVEETS